MWAVLDRASLGWRGVDMNPRAVRLPQDLRRERFAPPLPPDREEVVDDAVTEGAQTIPLGLRDLGAVHGVPVRRYRVKPAGARGVVGREDRRASLLIARASPGGPRRGFSPPLGRANRGPAPATRSRHGRLSFSFVNHVDPWGERRVELARRHRSSLDANPRALPEAPTIAGRHAEAARSGRSYPGLALGGSEARYAYASARRSITCASASSSTFGTSVTIFFAIACRASAARPAAAVCASTRPAIDMITPGTILMPVA